MERSLLSVRAALVLALAVLAGIGAGVLTALAGDGAARSVLYGLAAAGVAVPFFDRLVEPGVPQDAGRGPAAGGGGDD
ncbi:hypothetical protein [Streptomyces yaizuensis]|uniref:Uncharacterized protein n=1 Tax=Streptomyces yaizuensis TaxID=2989713 RepID=A0ABQ5PB85_9ACTN|nr:hypothetical protein [Streptomyces sp. YSPA8]GLF99834.1 hypothetical protein SYYSPA8_36075 [Streptomyces sp. YSPA8]